MIIKDIIGLKQLDTKVIIYEKVNYNTMLMEFFKNCIRDISFSKEKLAVAQTKETGKPIKYCFSEIERCIIQFKEAISYITKINNPTFIQESNFSGVSDISLMPIGTVLAITTFSSPYSSFVHKLIPSIITQNKFIFKPSPKVFNCSNLFFQIINNNYLKITKNSIFCLNFEDKIIEKIFTKISFDYIMFTGTSRVAKLLKDRFPNIPGIYETGSNAMAYIEDYYDLNKLGDILISNAFDQSGMRCVGLKNVFINKKISNTLVNILVEKIKKLKYGNPLNNDTVVGPIYDRNQKESLKKVLKKLKNNGYEVLYGGEFVNNILKPTILFNKNGNVSSTDEMYGPILCVHIVNGFEDIKKEYYSRSSINTAIYTESNTVVNNFVSYCESLTVCVNYGPATRLDTQPFGGKNDENSGVECLCSIIPRLSKEKYIVKNIG